jgi:DNA-binding CsgD family transcriptional regulator
MKRVPVEKMVQSLYDAVLNPEPNFLAASLAEFATHFDAPYAILATSDTYHVPSIVWAGVDTRFQNLMTKSFIRGPDPVLIGPGGKLVGQPFTERMVMSTSAFLRTAFYQDWCRPQHIETLLGAEVIRDHRGIALVGLGRDRLFHDADLSSFHKLMPDLNRVIALRLRLMELDLQNAQLRALLDKVGTPILLTDRTGRLLYANQTAEHLFQAGDVLRVRDGRLATTVEHETNALRSLVHKAGCGGGGANLYLLTPDGRRFEILVVPTPTHHAWAEGSDGCVAVFVMHSGNRSGLQPTLLRGLYGLTPTEAKVANLVSRGDGLSAAASALGIKISTARTHLHRIFDKTGTRRQSELARLIVSLPQQQDVRRAEALAPATPVQRRPGARHRRSSA